MSLVRKISPLDCSYLAMDTDVLSPMVNQYIVTGVGGFSQIELKAALEEAAEKNPGIRLRLKGRWFWRYWDSEGKVVAIINQKNQWSGSTSEQALFDGNSLNCRAGECAELHYFEGEFPKLVFRSHHAVLDGNATLFWIKEVFRALRREALLGSICDLNEWELSERFKKPLPEKFMGPWLSIFPKLMDETLTNNKQTLISDNRSSCHWLNVVIKNNDKRVLAKTIAFINEKARKYVDNPSSAKVVVRVPSDLRRLLSADEPYQLSNLVSALDLEVANDDDTLSIYKKIMTGLKKKQDLAMFTKFITLAKFLPRSTFLQKQQHFENLHEQGLADITAIVTHVGKVALAEFSTPDFKTLNIYALPVPLEGVSLSCVFIEHDQGLSLSMSAPKRLITLEGLKALADELALYLNSAQSELTFGKH